MEKIEIGRLAFRVEGEFWNVYWVPQQDSMKGALLLGSIRMSLTNGAMRDDFIKLMQDGFSTIANDLMGENPTWSATRPAPEDERSGNA